MVVKACEYWKKPGNPQSWQEFSFEGDQKKPHKYLRYANVFWRSDGSGADWSLVGPADPFIFANGRYGHPRDPSAVQGGGNGSDRPEFYACPFTGYLYLTAQYLAGGYEDESLDSIPAYDGVMLLCSLDEGLSWQVLKDDFGGPTPLVMNSTPNGRLFLYQWISDWVSDSEEGYGYGKVFCSNIFEIGEAPTVSELLGPPGGEHVVVGDSYSVGFTVAGELIYAEKAYGHIRSTLLMRRVSHS
jgi:hypothetical protein